MRGAGETLKLLNGRRSRSTPDLLVIADDAKPFALAGIMGGAGSAVSLDTRDILLESAFFAPDVIAGKSRVLGFGSDSSFRFERGVDFAATAHALDRATALVLEICGGQAGPVCRAQATLPERRAVRLRAARAQRLLGIQLAANEIARLFARLGFACAQSGDEFNVTPPSYRFDLAIEEDLVEEVARVHGYDNIPANAPVAAGAMLPAPESRTEVAALRQLSRCARLPGDRHLQLRRPAMGRGFLRERCARHARQSDRVESECYALEHDRAVSSIA